jgi:CheY-like chemotaxis protein
MIALSPKRVLVVEDEMMIAMLIETMLAELGHAVVGAAPTLAAALDLARSKAGQFDVAILDINLGGERSFPVARLLSDQGAPFIFATGYGTMGLDEPFRDAVTLNKPFQMQDLAAALERATAA